MTDLFVVDMIDGVSYVYDTKTLKLYKVPMKEFIKEAGSSPVTFLNVYIGYGGKICLESSTHHFTQGKYGTREELYIYNNNKFTLGGRYHTITVLESMTGDNAIVSDISVDGEILKYDFSDCVAWKGVWLHYVVQYRNYYLFYYKFDDCSFTLVFDKYSLLYVIGNDGEFIGGIQKEFLKAKIGGLVGLFYDMRSVATDDVLHFEF